MVHRLWGCRLFQKNITNNKENEMKFLVLISLLLVTSCAPKWYVEWRGDVNKIRLQLRGQASLLEAEEEKKISIEEAKALKESAVYKAQAEVIRAKGVAKANKIIGKSLKGNQGYLRYLWIQNMNTDKEVIYIPTEAGLPILEANRKRK